jgi:hypothetical protein
MPTIKHLLNWGPDTPYCQTEVSYDPAEFESEESLRGFLSGAAIEALEMKESYINAGLGIGPGGMVQEAKNLGATEIARPAAPQMPTPQQTQHRRGQLPRDGKWSGVAHAQCGFEFAFKPSWYNQKTGKRVGASLQCTGGCKNDRGYAYSEWVQDADLAMFEAP